MALKKKKEEGNGGSVKSTTVKNNGKTDTNLVNGKSFRLENTVGSIPRNNGMAISVHSNLNVQNVNPVQTVKKDTKNGSSKTDKTVKDVSESVLINNAGKSAPYATNYNPIPRLVKIVPNFNAYDRNNPIVKQYQDSKLTSKYLQDGYKLNKQEKKRAKQIVKDYYENEYDKSNWNDEKQKKYEDIVRLENKTSTGAAIMQGMIDAMPFTKSIEENASKKTGINPLQENRDSTNAQNKAAVVAGNMAGQLAKYGVGSQLMQATPIVGKATQAAGNALSKLPVLNKVGAEHIANVLGDTALDVALDTIPSAVDNISSGKDAGEVTKEAAKNLGTNLGYNILGEGIGAGIDALQKARQTKKSNAIPRLDENVSKNATESNVKTPMQERYDNVEQLRNKQEPVNKPVQESSIPNVQEVNQIKAVQKPMSDIEVEQTKADLFKVTGDIKRDLRNTTNMYYKGENKKEVVSAVEKMIDDYAENPTDENFEMLTKAVNLLNNSMYGQKYTRKRNGVTSVYDNELSVLFNNNVDALCDKATKLSQRTVAESVASNPTFTAEVPKNTGDMQTGPVTAENGQKISKVRTNTMQNSGIATDAELEKNFKDSNYAYNTISEEESLKMAKSMVDSLGDNAADAIINNGVNQSYEVDAAMLSWSKLMGQAREMEAQGLDNTAILKKADRLMRQVQKTGTESGQNIQAFAKWTRTPEGVMKATQDVVANKNKAKLGKNGSKKYDAVMDAADKVSDVFSNGMTYDEAVKYLMDYRSSNPDVEGMNTMLRIVNECKKNNMKLSEDSFKAVVESNPDILPREMKKMLKEGRTTADAGDFIRAMNNVEGLSTGAQKRIADIIQGVQNFELNSPELQKAVDQINIEISKEFPMSKWDKFVEAMHIGMLCHTRTDVRNTLANVAMLPEQSMANKLSAVMQNCYAKFNKDFTPNQSVIVSKESKNIAKECYAQQKRSGVAGKYGDALSNDPLENIGNKVAFGMKGEKNLPSRIPVLEKAGAGFKKGMNTVSNKVAGESLFNNLSSNKSIAENIREFTYDLLELGDVPFVKANYVQRLASAIEAENKARVKMGIDPIKSVEDVPEGFIDLAFDTAMEATFKDDNTLTRWASATHKIPVIGDVVLPFSKTPANIVVRTADYSLIGGLRGLANCLSKKNRNVSAGIDRLSKSLTGTGTALLGMALAGSGVLIGSLSDDKDEAAFQKQQGIQPFSISTKGLSELYKKLTGEEIDLGDTYITVDWAQPATSNLMAGAEMFKTFASGGNPFDFNNIANGILSCAKAWGNTIIDNSLFSNVQDLFDTSHGQNAMDNLVDEISEYPLRLLPSSLNALAKTTDLKQRSTYDASSKLNTLKNQFMSKVPGLRDNLPQVYDTWGQEKVLANSTGQAAFNNFLNPSGASVATTTEIDSTIQDLYEKTGDNKVFPQKMSTSVTVNEQKKVLNTQEYADYQKSVGQTSYKFAKAYLSSDACKNSDSELKAGNLNTLYGLSKAIYEKKAFGKEMSDSNKKYYEHYQSGGLDELMEYVDYKNTLGKYELSDTDKMIEIWDESGADGLKQYAERKEAFKEVVGSKYSSKSKGNAVYDERGESGLDMWNKIRSASLKTNESGSKSVDSQLLYNAVSNTNLSDEDKGYYIMNIAPKSDKLDKLYEDFGYENVYRYYKHKYSADYDGNGSLKKDEITTYLNQQDMTNAERGYWYDILSGGNTKNPY